MQTRISPDGPIVGAAGPGLPAISFLGVCEATPRIEFTPRFTPVHSDIAGAEVPHDWIYSGKDASLFCSPLTVWNWDVLLGIMKRPGAGASPFGIDTLGARGSLMNTEGFSFTLWCHFPYFTKPAFSPFMPGGFRFPYSFCVGPDIFDMGTKPNKINVAFQMTSSLDPLGNWFLCDSNMSGIPYPPPAGNS